MSLWWTWYPFRWDAYPLTMWWWVMWCIRNSWFFYRSTVDLRRMWCKIVSQMVAYDSKVLRTSLRTLPQWALSCSLINYFYSRAHRKASFITFLKSLHSLLFVFSSSWINLRVYFILHMPVSNLNIIIYSSEIIIFIFSSSKLDF